MTIIQVKLILEDACNGCDGDALEAVKEMIGEVFGKEDRKEFPRIKLILFEAKHTS